MAVFAVLVGLVVARGHTIEAGQDTTPAVLTTAHFAFHSDLRVNVNDALAAEVSAKRGGRLGLFEAGLEKTCFEALSEPARAGWARAVEHYRTSRSTQGQRVLWRLIIAGYVGLDTVTNAVDRDSVDAFARAISDATASYHACKWSAQDSANRTWVATLGRLLGGHEASLGEQLPILFRVAWAGLPFRVDVVGSGGFSGADSVTADSGRLHIQISSVHANNQANAALEVVFHEASHFLAQPGRPLDDALSAAARAGDVTLPRDILHQVQFYLTGEAVRRSLERAGASYTPYLYRLELFTAEYRTAAAGIWPDYLDGKRSLDQAAAAQVAAFKR